MPPDDPAAEAAEADVDRITRVARRVLIERLGAGVALRPGRVVRTAGSLVVRCHVSAGPAGAPATVIAKAAVPSAAIPAPYAPDRAAAPNAAHALLNDWAAAAFLGRVPDDPPLAPACYGGSRADGVLVLEDLGDGEGPNTHEALFGTDPALAAARLVEHAALLARLHARTMGRAAEYRRIRDALGPPPVPAPLFEDPWAEAGDRPGWSDHVDAAVRRYREVLAAVGVRVGVRTGDAMGDEIRRVAAAVERDPGPLLAYCKGDQNLAGDYLRRGGTPRLFDFGAGGLRHALVEGLPARLTWGCMLAIPRAVRAATEAAYRAELARGWPRAADAAAFGRAAAEAGGRWHVLHVVHRLPEALVADRPRGPTTLRQQVLAWLAAFAELAEEVGELAALGAAARAARARLVARWAAEAARLPAYPAFRGAAGTA